MKRDPQYPLETLLESTSPTGVALLDEMLRLMNQGDVQAVIAQELEIPSSHLSVFFHLLTGASMQDYLDHIRVRRASKLLAESSLGIHEIARQVGFEFTISLTRLFKRLTGVTPGEYRRNHPHSA
ncbi:MAG: helix-turn-helix transcriptional regulator [Prevotellaceae bacterium]|jgi:transcriptional regulator GlxA family with amidase domain|nr:helix-turn-helix transcriptional regulator [Prevotellaceae bacterium]